MWWDPDPSYSHSDVICSSSSCAKPMGVTVTVQDPFSGGQRVASTFTWSISPNTENHMRTTAAPQMDYCNCSLWLTHSTCLKVICLIQCMTDFSLFSIGILVWSIIAYQLLRSLWPWRPLCNIEPQWHTHLHWPCDLKWSLKQSATAGFATFSIYLYIYNI